MKPGFVAVILLGALALSGGCMPTYKGMVKAGHDPAYAAGFVHGQSSGRGAAGEVWSKWFKLPDRYEAEPLYRQGWDDGYTYGYQQVAADRQRQEEFNRHMEASRQETARINADLHQQQVEQENARTRQQVDAMYQQQREQAYRQDQLRYQAPAQPPIGIGGQPVTGRMGD